MTKSNKKLIVFDTDGVIFKSQLLLYLSWYSGIFIYVRAIYLCFLFNISYLTIRELLDRIYIKIKGIKEEELWRVYHKMKLVKHAEETIRHIRNRGHYVALISSGVPDILMKNLARRMHASNGYGIEAAIEEGSLTGKIDGLLSFHEGKVRVVEQLLKENNITWDNVIVVGDDRNNLDIMALAKASIGFNSNYPVRKKAKYVADGNDLKIILDFIEIEDDPTFMEISSSLRREFSFSWRQEFRRKGIHICSALVPFFASINFLLTIKALIIITLLYILSEWIRLNGIALPILNVITKLCVRSSERRRLVLAPVTLSLGVVFSLLLFSKLIACIVILIAAFSDSIATIIGRFYGRHKIPYNHGKSLEGSLAFFRHSIYLCYFLYSFKDCIDCIFHIKYN
ncbi:MAG: putative phosphatidate cytidylyltransferase [Candidatus Scalindua rubra]|uniref:Putative phosphatidate cytidylyltransferase n=1 Tax=Candidatus Scalindua rubra TaxID=1872076 RepID=A0A1E3XFA0_9BACT|nr:MAG: putative phosphatidate cytidylyltransferase [Candidatus Scalindua rubra]